MLNAFLVDDERLAVERLTRLLQTDLRIRILGSATDPQLALEQIESLKPDLLFLDIQMPEMDGFQLLQRLSHQPLVIFATAYDQYALQAFETNSVAYLLKPIEQTKLTQAIDKLEAIRGGRQPAPDLNALLAHFAAKLAPTYPERISSRSGDRVEFIDLSRVTHFYAEDKLSFAATELKTYIIDQTITELEGKLDPARFFRIHRSTLVNLAWVSELYTYFGGKLMLRLKDAQKTELTASKDRARELREKLGL
ncbi:LytR/AlgR family response regulator transcription factor [Bryobacter aggregatus]|uniref:LytR/AlgR family response regulator transcription factor n=1 Tax=Bryobacter aggregatus TaxID=360054 RepID=UPI0004E25835|nr:LytTR family DNA-binding domain-containing protein [Bryobacter aggregatus]